MVSSGQVIGWYSSNVYTCKDTKIVVIQLIATVNVYFTARFTTWLALKPAASFEAGQLA